MNTLFMRTNGNTLLSFATWKEIHPEDRFEQRFLPDSPTEALDQGWKVVSILNGLEGIDWIFSKE